MAPDADGTMRKIAEDVRAEEGRALARLGDGGWDPAVQAGRRAGRFDDELVEAAAELLRHGRTRAARAGSRAVPSVAAARSCPDFAQRLADAPSASRTSTPSSARETRPPQREMANSLQQVANVRGAFAVTQRRSPTARPARRRPALRGWTLAMVGGQLRRNGVPAVYPLALATAF